MIRYWRAILAEPPGDTGRVDSIPAGAARYWQGIRYWQSRRILPILAGLAILAGASLACSAPAWAPSSTASPAPTSTKTQTEPKPAKVSPTVQTLQETVTALQALNVRKDPTKRSESLRVLLSGEAVTLTGVCSKGWAQIQLKDVRAWVDSRYISGDLCKEQE